MNKYNSWELRDLEAEHARLNEEKRKIRAELVLVTAALRLRQERLEAVGLLEQYQAQIEQVDEQLELSFFDRVKAWLGL